VSRLSAKEYRALDMLAKAGEIDWSLVHANTVHALERKGLVATRYGRARNGVRRGTRVVTEAGQKALASVPNIFDDLFAAASGRTDP
jgi:DNA-binding MarR family transcriptional regulator